jgi:hypothetical protein
MATKLFSAVLLCVVLCSGAASAQAAAKPVDPFLAQLAGNWDLTGTVRGKPVRQRQGTLGA